MTGEQLREVRAAYKERKQLEEKIVEFEFMRVSPRTAVYGTERVQTSARGDMQPDTIAKLDELIATYNAKLKACVELIAEFESALEVVNSKERRILRMYYIDGMTWEQVCVEANMSWTNLHRMRKKALGKILE